MGGEEYAEASKISADYNLKPSDALHVAAMTTNGISVIASEDEEMGRVRGIRRIWT
ncbi:MAG: type II toxin-antitoxin system VapC family toxin [Candidatus Bathyarchaeia archaeon]